MEGDGAVSRDVVLELDQYPEDRTEERLEPFAVPAIRRQLLDFLECRKTGARPVADIEAMKLGAYDYLAKPFQPSELLLTIRKARERERLRRANALLQRPYRAPWVHPVPSSG